MSTLIKLIKNINLVVVSVIQCIYYCGRVNKS
nr:MAG TPA: hypothetical protein [Caudoviricetes sp.]